MSIQDFIVLVIIAGLSGFIASQIMGAKRINIIMLVALGFIGALVGRFIASWLGLPAILTVNIGGQAFPLLWAVVGSIVVVGIGSSFGQHS